MSLLERVRPAWSTPVPAQQRTSAYLAGAIAGLRAAGISLAIIAVPLLAAWAVGRNVTAGWTQALRVAASGWLLVQHVAVDYPGGRLGLAPLGLTLVPALALYRSARKLSAEPLLAQGFTSTAVNLRPVAQATAGMAAAAAAVATLVALLVGTDSVRPVLWQAPLGPALLAAAAGAAGLLRGHPRGPELRRALADRLPGPLRSALGPAGLAVVFVLAVAFAAVLLMLVTDASRVLALHRALDPGAFGGGLLVAGQIGYLPDLTAWSVSWLAGPGFAVGTGTVVSASQVHLGVLPVVPVLGALPAAPVHSTALVAAALAVPVLAGAVAGWWGARRAPAHDLGRASRLLDALVTALVAAGVLGVLVALSAGPIGPGRLAQVGADALVVTPFLALELALGALPVAAAVAWRRRRSAPGWAGSGLAAEETGVQVTQPPVEL
jgi:hypothetical protein